MTKTKCILPDELIGIIENNDFSVFISGNYVTFSKYSSMGQDWSIDIEIGNSLDELLHNIYEAYQNYDPDFEASLWIGDDGHGKNGAPYYIEDIVDDMKECEGFIDDLFDIVNEYNQEHTIED